AATCGRPVAMMIGGTMEVAADATTPAAIGLARALARARLPTIAIGSGAMRTAVTMTTAAVAIATTPVATVETTGAT
ncbi:hypothetical protein FBU31_006383, partial [Coemansia sp. 'formosensis']